MTRNPSAHVIVLGDLSRSPRILAQARFLVKENWDVAISGYNAHFLSATNSAIKAFNLTSCHDLKGVLPRPLAFIVKFFVTMSILLIHLLMHCREQLILVQNPPALPTFIVLWLYIKLTGKKLIIDWHNYGYTLMALNSSQKSFYTRLYYQLEINFASRFLNGRIAHNIMHLCVSDALKIDLEGKKIDATVYYDRPLDEFKITDSQSAHVLFSKLSDIYPSLKDGQNRTRFTRFTEYTVLPTSAPGPQWRPDRPALVVSSCSWTADDDFNLMIDALDMYEQNARLPHSNLPCIVFAVTGRGPLKDHYANIIKSYNWHFVEVIMPWLEWADYPVFLGSADLGISLHRTSSGLDLPMKVVDLLGVNVPVLALTYPTLNELLPNKEYGLHFETATQLTTQLCRLLRPDQTDRSSFGVRFSKIGSTELLSFRDAISQRYSVLSKGYDYWQQAALPVYEACLSSKCIRE